MRRTIRYPLCLMSLICVMSVLFTLPASAQFEGEIRFRAHEPGNMISARYMDFTITPQRILMHSDEYYPVIQGVRANGLLIRHDQEDFVFRTADKEGIRITRDDIDGLSALLSRMPGAGQAEGTPNWDHVEETGRSKEVQGYQTHQFIIHDPERNAHTSVWLTDGIKINWGIVENVWKESTSAFVAGDLPIEVFMNRNSFPLQIEYFQDEQLLTVIDAVSVTPTDVEQTMMDIPRDMRLVGFGELMMRIMRERSFGQ